MKKLLYIFIIFTLLIIPIPVILMGQSLPNLFPSFASLTTATGNISTTETVVISYTQVGSTFKTGSMVRVSAQGTCTTGITPGSLLYRVRVGPTTLTGTSMGIASPTPIASQTSKHFDLQGYIAIRSVSGTTTTIDSESTYFADPSLLVFGAGNFGGSVGNTVDTTVNNLVELTFQTNQAGSSCSFFMALLEQII